jgi:hypothetical protein
VCTVKELKEIMDLEVVTAVWWDKDQECSSLEEWVETVVEFDTHYFSIEYLIRGEVL